MPGMFRPGSEPDLELQRKMAKRARVTGRRWILRAVLLFAVATVAFSRPGSLMLTLGIVCLVLGILSGSLGWQTRKSAEAIEQKIDLMQKMNQDRPA